MPKGGYTYIMSNKQRTTLYIGVTSDLETRVYQHRNGEGSKFTKKYRCYHLIYFEVFEAIESAIEREKVLKRWNRSWKEELIKGFNPQLRDLWDQIQGFN
ncbi:GIY-YIG nuclease family protein [Roseivirga misakiensis]|uniref:Endonuclease n=1 Tax=Roseivirga misakiensis TaxID=1563681 RepID=A0A1E5SKW1_9BACT|nr:GIY-YIG nuclease family protein [Roseivirga misakiensis]OEJ99760.1 endonuclease [Roseivirga misakiensis]